MNSKCSSDTLKKIANHNLRNRLEKNGFRKIPRATEQKKKTNKEAKSTFLELEFINDRCNRKINKILQKYDFNIKVVSKPAKFLKHCFGGGPQSLKHDNCEVCFKLPDRFTCNDKFLVYEFTCKYCKNVYIGQTCRPFKARYNEHTRSLNSNNKISALSEHAMNTHHNNNASINDFQLNIIKRCKGPLETRLAEANAIDRFRPQLNRKHECI